MSSKAVQVIFALILCIIAIAGTLSNADATLQNQELVTKIQNDNKAFTKMLNAKSDPEALMKFLHEKIDNDAKIVMKINNPEAKDAGVIEMKLSKADYINSYIYGPRQVKNYHASIKTLKVDVDADSESITTKEMLTESGIMLNPHDYQDKGRPFTSYTSCESSHVVSETGDITLKRSNCHTDILYEESV